MTDNIFDYYKAAFAIAPDDVTLRELPIDSPCGDDCKGAIDAAKTWLHYERMAHGHSETLHVVIIDATYDIIETFWRG